MNATKTAWRTVKRNGATLLQAPDGTRYTGTAKEARAAALYPRRRNDLAQMLRVFNRLRHAGEIDAPRLKELAEAERREAIRKNAEDRAAPCGTLDENTQTAINAASRAEGMTRNEFIRAAIRRAIDETRKRNGGELPYTRQERAAVAAIC